MPQRGIAIERIRAFFGTVEPTTLAILFDFAHDLIRKVCNFSGSCFGFAHDLVRKVCNFSGSCAKAWGGFVAERIGDCASLATCAS
jgi:hypothetical protein